MDKRRINFSQKGFTNNLLSFMKMIERNELCCLDFLTQIFTADSTTIDFSGNGTESNPLIANVIVSPSPGNALTIEEGGLFVSGGGTGGGPAGSSNDIQFNEDGVFTADTGAFTYDPTDGSIFRTPVFGADITGIQWGDQTGNVFASGINGLQYSNLNGDHFTINSLNLNYTNGGADSLSIGGGNLNYNNTVDVFRVGGGNFNYNNSIDTLSASGGDFNYNSNTDQFRVGHSALNYSSSPDSFAIGASALNYGNTVDFFTIGTGLGYNNASTGDGLSVIQGFNYTNSGGANFQIWIPGNVSINLASGSPTGLLDIAAGVITPGGAPIKLHAGSLLTTPEAGAIEFDGTHYYGTIGSTRTQFDNLGVTNGLTITGNNILLGGTLTGITQLLTGGNVFRIRDSTTDPGHNLQHTFLNAQYIMIGDSLNSFSSRIEMQDGNAAGIGMRFINNTNLAGTGMLSWQMFNGVSINPSINFMNNGNIIIASVVNPIDDGTPIQIKSLMSTTSPVGIGVSGASITAHLHVSAGTSAAGNAPIKLNAGPLLTTPETGVFEFDGTHLYFTIGVTRTTLI